MDLEAAEEILLLPTEAKQLLDSVGLFERNLTRAKEVDDRAAVDFESKAKEFAAAALYHRKQARSIFCFMMATVVFAAIVICILFVFWPLYPGSNPSAQNASEIERVILISVGRIAILFFFAWALRYLGSLHKSHSEQAVLYLDRKAALGVAGNMLRASPELEQKRQLLQTLARGYLDFEQNAFRVVNKHSSEASDMDLEQLRKLTNALRPLLDTIKTVGEKAK